MTNPTFSIVNNPNPAEFATAVTPSDTVDLTQVTRSLYIGTGGNVNVDTPDGATILFSNVQSGSILPVRVKRVRVASTTASNIVALF